ncbi:MAG: enoyl-CoA hydratase/isomerase family protein [Deltaproteobacteria bacterium]|nr:enoyl-CoA hydratase/isomerase family protein [Deltaproteobacteria bacterium]MBW2396180.1 enoyl-CoA hydratase/isomerase family protein [Deltaproteobacteria bacterium]
MLGDWKTLELERDGAVAVLRLDRPDVLNAMSPGLIDDIREVLAVVNGDPQLRALVMTGKGRAFCAGADLGAGMVGPGETLGDTIAESMDARFNPLVREMQSLRVPIIAAVNGVAAGGGVGLALSCDLVLAAQSASFKLVFAPALGIVPDVGASYHLPHRVGRARALGLSLLGESLPAEKAEEWGLIWRCIPDDELMVTALELGHRLASGPTRAFVRLRSVFAAAELGDLDAQLDVEREAQRELCNSSDFKEGVAAFLQKRRPNFEGR